MAEKKNKNNADDHDIEIVKIEGLTVTSVFVIIIDNVVQLYLNLNTRKWITYHFEDMMIGVTQSSTSILTPIQVDLNKGRIYHKVDQLVPRDEEPRYLQLYFYDAESEFEHMLKWPNLDREIVTILSCVLAPNPYVQTFRSLGNLGPLDKYRVELTTSFKDDQRLYNRLTTSEVAGIWVEGVDIRELIDDDDDDGVEAKKYVYKGHDKQVVNVDKDEDQVINEIKRLQDAPYVSPPEAMWRIYGFPLSNIYLFVMKLQFHLPNNQLVSFREDHVLTDTLNRERNNRSTKQGKMRGKMVYANLAEGERFYLRVLLQHVKGPTGFDYLYTIDDVLYTTFHRAALERGLIQRGRTAHLQFKIPINLATNSMCNIIKQSGLAKLLCQAKLIIWDEASMAKRQAVEEVDRSMQDIKGVKLPFGGKIMVLGGDFRQVLPVYDVEHGRKL
uniref:ATP-dependent DNA helicase n=1 Tax=Tanacetum cinerariifolium TaxID=118510 RepID=A0A6L2JIV4_TANCI|nr:uncharacterized protein [Tanacetum cinerariifolium]